MKKLLFSLLLVLAFYAGIYATIAVQPIPTKLFDVRNGNGIVDSGTTYTRATAIVFKDDTAKTKVIDAFAAQYNYPATVPDPNNAGATIPNPQSKQAFMNARLTQYIREVYKAAQSEAAVKTAKANADRDADAELP